ncbi:bifunctional folylpolyglutamate synthase/dihydrofolate synthase [Metabacillus idriensis]|uniref:Dihydrofolate synthase/folylpolyglutamate synthase n=1 Tax=Metabacillus idriensis TaxID=324768 RepID=A0A6I2MF16_9BACI|nr:folylpolyglutamate synthase/dihydrofolate synthase family protein [Metabacillus idriensis]MCM3596411.1 bifunctional folylpolyglutamate synthase/dihydrofolate synthase [Metabacillus idriensis]MRX56895.1 bifunctional folylpolyglutamate synthase/dihydrofolate synthase [Metabacillus idriensis]OHR71925.1 bifunctional folylpolyglutamate synthase/dihydrofolate synthase [Bacillus sp. HMSC76G11]
MFQTYEEAVDWIHSRLRFGIKPGLKRMTWMMEKLNNPHKHIRAIHVAGTNGKGSTIAYMRNVLQEAGYTTGTFTSPFLETFNERISMNGKPISDEEMLFLVNMIRPLADELEETELGGPTEFEVITAMAFYYFGRHEKTDILLLETGLGGTYDSTNIAEPILTMITSIGYDHMNILGNTIEEIAGEKAGIIKQGIPMLTSVADERALNVIKKKANEMNASLYYDSFPVLSHQPIPRGERFEMKTPFSHYQNLEISMRGEHQVQNAALAVMALDYLRANELFHIDEQHVIKGLLQTSWSGRFEQVSEYPAIIVDGAHNKEGVESLAAVMKRHYHGKKIHILFSALKDKEYAEMIDILSSIADSMHFTTFDFPRAASAAELFEACRHPKKDFDEEWKSAFDKMMTAGEFGDIFLVTGSLYFISEVRPYCRNFLSEN